MNRVFNFAHCLDAPPSFKWPMLSGNVPLAMLSGDAPLAVLFGDVPLNVFGDAPLVRLS